MWISAADATRLLDVTHQTLYAYVSRGLIRSEAVPGEPRVRRYAKEDVERLQRRGEERRDPSRAAAHALQWGVPVLESSITLITEGRLYYRGHDVEELARTRSIAEVASLLWTGSFDGAFAEVSRASSRVSVGAFITRAQSTLPLAAARDPLAFDLRPAGVAQTGWRILNLLTTIAASSALLSTIDETLAAAWKPRAAATLRAALIACADHELNVSAFTARCIASSGANPYSVVLGALCALEGVRHGGATARVEALLNELRRAKSLRTALADRLAAATRSKASATRSTATATLALDCSSRCSTNTPRAPASSPSSTTPPAPPTKSSANAPPSTSPSSPSNAPSPSLPTPPSPSSPSAAPWAGSRTPSNSTKRTRRFARAQSTWELVLSPES